MHMLRLEAETAKQHRFHTCNTHDAQRRVHARLTLNEVTRVVIVLSASASLADVA
jgi:hypothetical protein